jgi:hypothetical protein
MATFQLRARNNMNDDVRVLLHDEQSFGPFLMFVTMAVPVGLAVGSLFFFVVGENVGAALMVFDAALAFLVLWLALPHRYQIYDDQLRIVLGGPFSVKIGFDQIDRIEITASPLFRFNLASRITGEYVRIVRTRGSSLAITPSSNEIFAESANRAIGRWVKLHGQTESGD